MLAKGGETTIEDLELPAVLYKYRRWDNADHKRMITESEFMYENPFTLCPCSELQFQVKEMEYNELLHFYFHRVRQTYPILSPAEQSLIAHREFRLSAYHNPGRVQCEIFDLFEWFDRAYGALSLGVTNVNNNLWDNFGSSGYGFCVGVNPRSIANESSHGGFMQYYSKGDEPVMKFPRLDQDYVPDIINIFFSLPEEHKREDEYRFFKHNRGAIQLPKESIQEVIIGYAMSEENRADFIGTVQRSLPNAMLLQSNIDNETGQISVSPLDF